ncbi:MAG: copper resistance protein CopC/CopD [Alphaproteobacteria bacterium]|nr:copper resistance protein CopC/CopD [Alphaproteobacteria bacterium]
MTSLLRAAIAMALALVLAAVTGDRAAAHSTLRASEPPDGAVLERPPARIVLEFDEPVSAVSLAVVDRAGRAIALRAPPRIVDHRLEAALPETMPPDVYAVVWRVASADAHPVAGTLVFAVGTTIPADFRPPANDGGPGWLVANIVLRFGTITATFVAAGGAIFGAVVAPLPRRLRRRFGTLAALGAVIAFLAIPVRGALLLGIDGFTAAPALLWLAAIDTRFVAAMIAVAAGLTTLAAAWRRTAARPALAGALGLASIAALAVSGHVAAVAPPWLMALAIVTHVTLAAFWIGALLPLTAALEGPPREAAGILRRFSRVAVIAVASLVLVGAVVAAVQLATPLAIESSEYGKALLVKLVGVTALLTLAIGNRLIHMPALAAGNVHAASRLRRAIRWEIAAASFVIGATAILGLTPPPRPPIDLAGATEPGVGATALGARISAVLEVTPGQAGRNRILVEILGADGEALEARRVELVLAPAEPAAATPRLLRAARSAGGFAFADVDLPVSGRWTLRLEVRISELEFETLTTEVSIR